MGNTGDFLGFASYQLSFRFSERPCLKEEKQRAIELSDVIPWCTRAHTYTIHRHIHTHKHAPHMGTSIPHTRKQISKLKYGRERAVVYIQLCVSQTWPWSFCLVAPSCLESLAWLVLWIPPPNYPGSSFFGEWRGLTDPKAMRMSACPPPPHTHTEAPLPHLRLLPLSTH